MNMIEEAMTFHWGERCEEYVQGCPICDAWKQYDGLSDACAEVKDGYIVVSHKKFDDYQVPLSEALTIRTVEDVRREAYAEGYRDGFKKSGWEEMERQEVSIYKIDTPAPSTDTTPIRTNVPEGQTSLDDKLNHHLLDVFNEGIAARDTGAPSPYHGHSLEHCLHASGWVQRDLRLALDADTTPSVAEAAGVNQAIVELEAVKDYAEQPLYNHLEVGFRHNPLTNAETLDRYKYACEVLSIGINAALRALAAQTGGE